MTNDQLSDLSADLDLFNTLWDIKIPPTPQQQSPSGPSYTVSKILKVFGFDGKLHEFSKPDEFCGGALRAITQTNTKWTSVRSVSFKYLYLATMRELHGKDLINGTTLNDWIDCIYYAKSIGTQPMMKKCNFVLDGLLKALPSLLKHENRNCSMDVISRGAEHLQSIMSQIHADGGVVLRADTDEVFFLDNPEKRIEIVSDFTLRYDMFEFLVIFDKSGYVCGDDTEYTRIGGCRTIHWDRAVELSQKLILKHVK